MQIKELTIQAFTLFAENSPLKNYMQSEEYARLMGESGYNYDYIGLVNENDTVVAASLILWKKIGITQKYGYAPKGFLLNYYDENLVNTFTQKLIEYYDKKKFIFIKINPEIVVSEINAQTMEIKTNPNLQLKTSIQKYGYNKLKDNLYFESRVPRFNAYINLKNSNFKDFSKANKNKIRNAKRKGLYIQKGSMEDIDEFYKLLLTKEQPAYYKNMMQLFGKNDLIDLILVRVDYEEFMKNSQSLYEAELDQNSLFNEILHRSHEENDLNRKMASDARLTIYKNEIIFATEGLRNQDSPIVAGALLIKNGNRIHVVESGFNRMFPILNANYYLYNALIENYKEQYDYLDIGGVSGDFKNSSPYAGLNRFKSGFNPSIYEFIGEYDLVINQGTYDYISKSGKLAREFPPN